MVIGKGIQITHNYLVTSVFQSLILISDYKIMNT